jgi:hypothetical protein
MLPELITTGYFSVILPAMASLPQQTQRADGAFVDVIPSGAHRWFSNDRELSRGAFRTAIEAHDWAHVNVGRAPYSVVWYPPATESQGA